MAIKVIPAPNCVIVRPKPKDTNIGDIVLAIPDNQGDMGEVISVGSKVNGDNFNLKEGDCIIFERHFAQNFAELNGNVIVKTINIIATIVG